MAQTQAVMAIMEKNKDLFNRRAVIERFLKQIKVPGVNELMTNVPPPVKIDAANENVAMTIGQAAFAYPEQDHLAHMQAHLDYAKDPTLGANPLIAPSFIPKVMEHLKQHIGLWYLSRMNGYVQKSMGQKLDPYEMLNDPKDVDRLYAMAAQHVNMDAQETLQGITPIVQQLVQLAQKYKQKPNLTPDGQVLLETSMAETKRRAARDQAEMQIKAQSDAQRLQMEREKMEQEYEMKLEEQDLKIALALGDQEMQERIEAARLSRDAARLRLEQEKAEADLLRGV
jgi:hypothetical protein